MIFTPLTLEGAYLVNLEPMVDERGSFSRMFCAQEFADAGLVNDFPQCNLSINSSIGTLRGMHFQRQPYEEAKLVRCIKGCIYDVIVDLRKDSKTYGQYEAVELSQENYAAVYVPVGFAHGFQTLTENTDVLYFMGENYKSDFSGGVRWDDPAFSIDWRLPVSVISERDRQMPDWKL